MDGYDLAAEVQAEKLAILSRVGKTWTAAGDVSSTSAKLDAVTSLIRAGELQGLYSVTANLRGTSESILVTLLITGKYTEADVVLGIQEAFPPTWFNADGTARLWGWSQGEWTKLRLGSGRAEPVFAAPFGCSENEVAAAAMLPTGVPAGKIVEITKKNLRVCLDIQETELRNRLDGEIKLIGRHGKNAKKVKLDVMQFDKPVRERILKKLGLDT